MVSKISVVDIGEWEVQVRVVPPTATFRWDQSVEVEYPPKPPRPMSHYDSIAGHVEEVPALPETKEYDDWMEAMEVWEQECNQLRETAMIMAGDFVFDYAILAWRHKSWDEDRWESEPPDDWKPSDAYERHGVEISGIPRLMFIQDELLLTQKILDAVRAVMYPDLDIEQDTSPIREEEVNAALHKFRVGNVFSRAARYLGRGSRERRKARHKDESLRK